MNAEGFQVLELDICPLRSVAVVYESACTTGFNQKTNNTVISTKQTPKRPTTILSVGKRLMIKQRQELLMGSGGSCLSINSPLEWLQFLGIQEDSPGLLLVGATCCSHTGWHADAVWNKSDIISTLSPKTCHILAFIIILSTCASSFR